MEYRFSLSSTIDRSFSLVQEVPHPDQLPVLLRGDLIGMAGLEADSYVAELTVTIAEQLTSGQLAYDIDTNCEGQFVRLTAILIVDR